MSCQVSEWSSSRTYTAQRRHVRCRSRDPSRLRHHLLVSTYVSPVGPITVVCGAGDPTWLQKTKRHQSSAVCRGVKVASMSRSWRDWGLVPLPCSQKETESISGGLMVCLLKYTGWSDCWWERGNSASVTELCYIRCPSVIQFYKKNGNEQTFHDHLERKLCWLSQAECEIERKTVSLHNSKDLLIKVSRGLP